MSIFSELGNFLSDIHDDVHEVSQTFSEARDAVVEPVNEVKDNLGQSINDLGETASEVKDSLR